MSKNSENHLADPSCFGSCSECRRLHGASVENLEDYAPGLYVKAFSFAYCAQAPSSPAALLDYATIWTSTATIDLGTSTGGSDVLGSSTAVSLYAPLAALATSTSISTTSSSSQTGSVQGSQTGSGPEASSSSGADALAISKVFGVGLLGLIWSL